MARLHMRVSLPQVGTVARRLGVSEDGEVQKAVTREVLGRIKAYMPKKTGELSEGKTRMESSAKITVDGPYARAQFFGVTSDGAPFEYDTSRNPKAGPHWDRRLASEEGRAIAAKVERLARRGMK